jgi:hypothetical protein
MRANYVLVFILALFGTVSSAAERVFVEHVDSPCSESDSISIDIPTLSLTAFTLIAVILVILVVVYKKGFKA